MTDRPPTLFISYSGKDRAILDELLSAVRPTLRNISTLVPWVDKDNQPGDHWQAEIEQALARAKAALLLIANHFTQAGALG